MRKAAFFTKSVDRIDYVYAKGRKERLQGLMDLYPEVITDKNFAQHAAALKGLEVIFSTWGMFAPSDEQFAQMPALKALFYGAGSVTAFAAPFLRRGMVVVSAWAANAIPVAEFALSQILLSCKGYFRDARACKAATGDRLARPRRSSGVFGETVGVIGAGQVGRRLMELLKGFNLRVVVYDPYLSDEDAARLGARKVSLDELFSTSYVVSNHLPNIPATRKMLGGALFERMRDDASFINTGRGAQVEGKALIAELKKRPDLTALLDVYDTFSPEDMGELRALPNAQLSSHIAGSINDEVVRMADYMIEEFQAWDSGRPLRYAVTLDMLKTLG